MQSVAKLINTSDREARDIIKMYGLYLVSTEKKLKPINTKEHSLPTNVEPLGNKHRKYLEKRGFDPDEIIQTWNIVGTGPVSLLDKLNYSHRIVIPIIWDGHEVSFTTRDITDKSEFRYITCPMERELIHHKHILYGKQSKWGETGICVEGPTDVWRMRENSFCTFGIYSNTITADCKNF
jgi:hypothetical protein